MSQINAKRIKVEFDMVWGETGEEIDENGNDAHRKEAQMEQRLDQPPLEKNNPGGLEKARGWENHMKGQRGPNEM